MSATQRPRLACLGAVLALALLPACARDGVERGVALVEAEKYEAARRVFQREAQAGSAQARYYLGALSRQGLGGERNLADAAAHYRAAADAGVPEAKLALGALLTKGDGVPQDLQRALELYRAAAEAGLAAAQLNLGMLHAAGLAHTAAYGASEDMPRAYKWFRVVIESADAEAYRRAAREAMAFLAEHMTTEEVATGEEMARVELRKPFAASRRAGGSDEGER